MLKRISALGIVLAATFSLACGGDSVSSDESEDGLAMIRSAQDAMAELDTLTIKQTMVTEFLGQAGELVVTTSVEGSDKGYVTVNNSLSFQRIELVYLGDEAYIKQGTPGWKPISLAELGIDPTSTGKELDILATASGSDIKGTSEEGGVRVRQVSVLFDGDKYKELLELVFLTDSVVGRQLDSAKLEKIRADFYVNVEDGTLHSAVVETVVDIKGNKCRNEILVEYFDFNKPVKYPADVPFPVS